MQTRRGRHDVKAMSPRSQHPHPTPPFEKARAARGRATRLSALLLLGLLLSLFLSGCSTEKEIEIARQKGVTDGLNDGRRVGEADGRKATYDGAKDSGYSDTLNEMRARGEYNLVRSYTVTVLVVSFLIGFALQYTALYLLRRNETFFDIDRIVLRGRATRVDLSDLSGPDGRSLATRQALELLPAAKPHEESDG